MDLRGVARDPGVSPVSRPDGPSPARKIGPHGDFGARQSSDIPLVRELSDNDLHHLLNVFSRSEFSETAAEIDDLLHALTSLAAERGIANGTSGRPHPDPTSGELLRGQEATQDVRAQVSHLLNRLTAVAKMDAEARLSLAVQALDDPHPKRVPGWNTDPEMLVRIATRMFDKGGYSNYVRVSDVSQIVIDAVRFIPAPTGAESIASDPAKQETVVAVPANGAQKRKLRSTALARQVGAAWRHLPNLVILLVFLAAALLITAIAALLKR